MNCYNCHTLSPKKLNIQHGHFAVSFIRVATVLVTSAISGDVTNTFTISFQLLFVQNFLETCCKRQQYSKMFWRTYCKAILIQDVLVTHTNGSLVTSPISPQLVFKAKRFADVWKTFIGDVSNKSSIGLCSKTFCRRLETLHGCRLQVFSVLRRFADVLKTSTTSIRLPRHQDLWLTG